MQIIVNIPESEYQRTIRHYKSFPGDISRWEQRIVDGTVLPKEYGDLVDRDEINSRFNAICDELENRSNAPSYKELLDKLGMCLDAVKPVIENNYENAEEELWR